MKKFDMYAYTFLLIRRISFIHGILVFFKKEKKKMSHRNNIVCSRFLFLMLFFY